LLWRVQADIFRINRKVREDLERLRLLIGVGWSFRGYLGKLKESLVFWNQLVVVVIIVGGVVIVSQAFRVLQRRIGKILSFCVLGSLLFFVRTFVVVVVLMLV